MAQLTIPTEFRAVDKFTDVVKKMTASVSSFAKSGSAAIQRINTRLDRMVGLTDVVKGALTGLTVAALFSTAIKDLQAYEDGLASFRTIVSDLSNKEFSVYEKAVGNVAKETRKSTTDVVMSFEKIAGLNAEFAKTSEGISSVSKSAIVLSRASRDELGASAENLVGIMNQFNLEANQADRTINVLAAGQAVGAASITQTAESMKNFGSVAAGANISLEQSVGLIQTLGKFSLFGAEAGTKLRGSVLKLQQANLGYKSGQFDINDALAEAQAKVNKLSTAKKKDAYLTKVFGAENITAGRILLSNIGTFNEYTKGVTDTSEAQKAAAINSNTLREQINQLKASFTNFITTNDQTNTGLNITKIVLGFVTNNMGSLITVGAILVGTLVAIKLAAILTTAATTAFSVALGIQTLLVGKSAMALRKNVIALNTYKIASKIAAASSYIFSAAMGIYNVALIPAIAATWAFTAALLANPLVWIIVAIIAAIAAIVLAFVYWDDICAWFGKQWDKFTNWIGEQWDNLVAWFEDFSFTEFFKDIGQAIIDWMLLPLKGILKLLSYLPGKVGNMAQKALDKVNEFTNLDNYIKVEGEQTVKQVASPQEMNTRVQNENNLNGNIGINVNDKGNNVSNVDTSGFGGIPVNVTSTQGAF